MKISVSKLQPGLVLKVTVSTISLASINYHSAFL